MEVAGHEAEVVHVHEADPQERSPIPAPAALADHILQRNPSPLPDHQRGEDLPLQGVPNLVHVHVHRHFPCISVMSYSLYYFVLRNGHK